MTLLTLLRARRPRANSGAAEIPVTVGVGRGRLVVPARIAAGYLPRPVIIRGSGAAAIPVTEAHGAGFLVFVDEEMLVRLLLSAA